jgi:hypothetical protein
MSEAGAEVEIGQARARAREREATRTRQPRASRQRQSESASERRPQRAAGVPEIEGGRSALPVAATPELPIWQSTCSELVPAKHSAKFISHMHLMKIAASWDLPLGA